MFDRGPKRHIISSNVESNGENSECLLLEWNPDHMAHYEYLMSMCHHNPPTHHVLEA